MDKLAPWCQHDILQGCILYSRIDSCCLLAGNGTGHLGEQHPQQHVRQRSVLRRDGCVPHAGAAQAGCPDAAQHPDTAAGHPHGADLEGQARAHHRVRQHSTRAGPQASAQAAVLPTELLATLPACIVGTQTSLLTIWRLLTHASHACTQHARCTNWSPAPCSLVTAPLCRLKPFGAELRAVRRSPWQAEHPAEALLDQRGTWSDLESLAADADILVLTCAQNELTREMINGSLLSKCRRGVLIINVARGEHRRDAWFMSFSTRQYGAARQVGMGA